MAGAGLVTDDKIVVAGYASTASEADTIVALLEANGIRAIAQRRQLEDVFPTVFSHEGVAVLVREDQLDEARAFLRAPPESVS